MAPSKPTKTSNREFNAKRRRETYERNQPKIMDGKRRRLINRLAYFKSDFVVTSTTTIAELRKALHPFVKQPKRKAYADWLEHKFELVNTGKWASHG